MTTNTTVVNAPANPIIVSHSKPTVKYFGNRPWFEHGVKIEGALTSEDAIKAGGLDWSVEKEQIQLVKSGKVIKDNFSIVRQDTGESLGIVGNKYKPMQNKDAFRFFDAVVGEKAAMYERTGISGEGSKVWILAKLPSAIEVAGYDTVQPYIMLSNTHDGTSSVKISLVTVRQVCTNTLTFVTSDADRYVTMRHTGNIGEKVWETREAIGLINKWNDEFGLAANHLTKKRTTSADINNYLKELGFMPEEPSKVQEAKVASIKELMDHGYGNDDPRVAGTYWSAYNGVSEYVDHYRIATKSSEDKFSANIFGSGHMLKKKAFDLALTMAGRE